MNHVLPIAPRSTRLRRSELTADSVIYYGLFVDHTEKQFHHAVIGIDQRGFGFTFNKMNVKSVPTVKPRTVEDWRNIILNQASYIFTSKNESLNDFNKLIRVIELSERSAKGAFIDTLDASHQGCATREKSFTFIDNLSVSY